MFGQLRCMWQQVGQSVRLSWQSLVDRLATGGKHQTTPGPTSVYPGQPVPTDSKHSPAQIHWHENRLCVSFYLPLLVCFQILMHVFLQGGTCREGLVFNRTLRMEVAVKRNSFSTTPGVKNLLVKWATVFHFFFSNFLMGWHRILHKGESFLSPPAPSGALTAWKRPQDAKLEVVFFLVVSWLFSRLLENNGCELCIMPCVSQV